MEGKLHAAMLQSKNFLDQFGHVILGLYTRQQARIALTTPAARRVSAHDEVCYMGKTPHACLYCGPNLRTALAVGNVRPRKHQSVF